MQQSNFENGTGQNITGNILVQFKKTTFKSTSISRAYYLHSGICTAKLTSLTKLSSNSLRQYIN